MSTAGYDLWRPLSACGVDCLPADGHPPAVPVARRLVRLLAVLGMLLAGAALAAVLPLTPAPARRFGCRAWAHGTARAFGVRLVIRGRSPRGRALLVANHVSWLDVVALLAVAPARLLAKREVRAWPLVGLLARGSGTVFVDRARPRALPATVRRVADLLRAGRQVAVYPEGTTWCGTVDPVHVRPRPGFRPAVFQAALDTGAPVVPVRIGYRCGSANVDSTVPAFLGEENLWRSVRRVLAARDLVVTVTVGAALHPEAGADRRALARTAESALRLMPVWKSGA
ncbi:lysophospholipid acyltransferase family protein [Micromonospora sp. NPDC023956]|uniref:lysophospholipid acyltransferase family protein n=1 Tax=Micromonospora sp. NPDC023956 TaxID=3155722 RepID=UPI0034077F25